MLANTSSANCDPGTVAGTAVAGTVLVGAGDVSGIDVGTVGGGSAAATVGDVVTAELVAELLLLVSASGVVGGLGARVVAGEVDATASAGGLSVRSCVAALTATRPTRAVTP
jgi:hypothetical protein